MYKMQQAKTQAGANRRYAAIYKELWHGGGGQFGFDLPTMLHNRPDLYREIMWYKENFRRLKP